MPWEYTIVQFEFRQGRFDPAAAAAEKALRTLGAEGWELTAVVPGDRFGEIHIAYLKREVRSKG